MNEFTNITLNVTEYRPCAGGTYLQLPPKLKSKRSLLNIRNNDDKCIVWAIAAALHPCKSQNQYRPSRYRQYFDDVNIKNVTFPTSISDIHKLETNNNLRINVYGYSSDPNQPKDKALNTDIFPRYISPYNYKTTVNVLLIANEHTQHYVLIKSLNALLREKTKDTHSKFCERCLQSFSKQALVDKHIIDCSNFKIQRTRMPEKTHIQFENIQKQLEFPVIIVADFESVLSPIPPPPPKPSNSNVFCKMRKNV
jgi:hypothetical protein